MLSLSLRFPHQNPVYVFLHTCHMPAHLILIDLIPRAIFGEEYRSLSSSLCSFLHSPVTSSLWGPNILYNTLLSNTLSLRFSLNVSEQDSHPHKTTGKIIVLYILVFKFLDSKTGRQNILHRMIASISWLQSASSFFTNKILIYCLFPNIWTLPHFKRDYYQYLYCDFVLYSAL